ncbi:type II/IV secretion system ATPase subunit [Candidatus Woesearchaeota archaeon]|nr:type II/IV secretion system ATPase subunit [Candidatus Woesearchaeota archaeon]
MAEEKKGCFDYEIVREGEEKVLRISCEECGFPPSIEDSKMAMAKTVELLMEIGGVTKLVLTQKRDYEYDYHQVSLLNEIAQLHKKLGKDERLNYSSLVAGTGCVRYLGTGFASLQHIISTELKSDPVSAYVELRRLSRKEKIKLDATVEEQGIKCEEYFISVIEHIIDSLEKTRLISMLRPYLAGYAMGDRSVYRRIFGATIRPDFMFTKLMATYPSDGVVLDSYSINNTEITIFGFPDSTKTLYHMVPPEFKFTEEKYELLDSARKIMSEHKPSREEFVDPARMREVFYNVGKDLIEDLISHQSVKLREKEIEELAEVLLRYTVGFGLMEVLLMDPKIQDANANSPMGKTPIFVVHGDFDDCYTNIIPSETEAESWATKLRMISGRPLDEANPILDTELKIPGMTSRVAAVTAPLNPTGLAFSFRRHRDKPWTLPLFIKAGMIDSVAAGLISFLIDGTRTMLIAGTRSSGKTSLLGSLLVEIMRRYRIITIEDTLELPAPALKDLGFNIQSMKVAGALAGKETTEVDASRGIRTTLRLGDSALIIGEVRSSEAIALYEAMRVGAAANVVAGTIHGASPYGVFDRVVNDIGVPRTSFKATDIIVVANPVRSAAGLRKKRRVLQITEVRKTWEDDPLREGGFVDLMKYNPETDKLEITDALANGDSEILKEIAGNVAEFAGNWEAVWNNIMLRAKCKQAIVDISDKTERPELLEAEFSVKANDMFHNLLDQVLKETGKIDEERVFFDFNEWLKKEGKKSK